MTAIKTCSLPSVLTCYSPDYEPRTCSASTTACDSNASPCHKVSGSDTSATPLSPTRTSARARHSKPRPRSKSPQTQARRQDIQRFERNFDGWHEVRRNERETKRQQLEQKICLQHQLIDAQDVLHEERLTTQQERHAKNFQIERKKRHNQENIFTDICKKSLADDRHRLTERRATHHRRASHDRHQAAPVEPCPAPGGPSHPSHASHIALPVIASPAGSVLREEEEREGGEGGEEEEEGLPWHHRQLYRLYGADADHFIHPKVEDTARPSCTAKPMDPELRRQCIQAGASVMWGVLRDDSRLKLMRDDTNLSAELKTAYSAFIRESLQQRIKPLKKRFFADTDVPDFAQLCDRARLHRALDFRHKVELMFRSSRINRDRSEVLLYNNPMPDLSDDGGTQGIGRYVVDTAHQPPPEVVEADYKKWLKPKASRSAVGQDGGEDSAPLSAARRELNFLMPHKKTSRRGKPMRILFLTEDDAKCGGPPASRRLENAGGHLESKSALSLQQPADTPHDKTRRSGSEMWPQYVTPWQPLSEHALNEYAKQQPAFGSGGFMHGGAAKWTVTK